MAKITRKELSRGTKLAVEHVNAPLTAISSSLAQKTIAPENLKLNKPAFSITLNCPRLPAYAFSYQDDEPSKIVFPIVLPPLQDQWTDNIVGDETPLPVLKSMSVSVDLGMGPNAVKDTWDPAAIDAELAAGDADIYDIELEIRSKPQAYDYGFNEDVIYNVAKETIFKQEISGLLFDGEAQQFNPIFINGIDETIDPRRTYLLTANFPNVWTGKSDPTQLQFCVSSLTIKLNFEGPSVVSDLYDGTTYPVQNIPSSFATSSQYSAVAFTPDEAEADQKITARSGLPRNGRIQKNSEALDTILLDGLAAGRDIHSQQPVSSSIAEQAGYTVMAVPMFGGWNDIRAEDINNIGLPYGETYNSGSGTPWNGYIQDRRIIPISQPFTIHHVFAVNNYYSHFVSSPNSSNYPFLSGSGRNGGTWGSGLVPPSTSLSSSIGVGISTGLRADDKQYEQVAYAQIVSGSKSLYLVDRIKSGKFAPLWGAGTASSENYDFEIFQIPLVQNNSGGRNTRGYVDQGYPYFIGKSGLGSRSRRNVGDVNNPGTPKTPNTDGGEQFIEVRWVINDPNGLNNGAGVNPTNSVYVGMGGHWIYLIGKMEAAETSF